MKARMTNARFDQEKELREFNVGIIQVHKGEEVVHEMEFTRGMHRDYDLSFADDPEEYVEEHGNPIKTVGIIPRDDRYEIVKIAYVGRDYPVWWTEDVAMWEDDYESDSIKEVSI